MERLLFSPSSTLWKVNRELAVGLAGPRAVLMQIAHPLVAAGVAQHSAFRSNRFGRLYRTSMAATAITFGIEGLAYRAARRVNSKHAAVHGVLETGAGRFASGTAYDANDPDLKVWVMATIVDSALLLFERFVGPLSDHEREDYYRDSIRVAHLFGTPADWFPPDYSAFHDYMVRMLGSDHISVSTDAREITRALFTPSPGGRLLRWSSGVGIALLPDRLRHEFGFQTSSRNLERVGDRIARFRAIRPWLPGPLVWSPFATLADALCRVRVVGVPAGLAPSSPLRPRSNTPHLPLR